MRSFLISGSYTMNGFNNDVMMEFKKEMSKINDLKKLCFIPTDFSDIKKNKERCRKIQKWFKKHNIIFDDVFIIDDSVSNDEACIIINSSNVIFLNGGDTLMQIDGLNKKNIRNKISSFSKIIVGMSAGAINMAKNVLITKDEDDNIPETMLYPGIGVTNINVEPHCDFSDKNHWNDLIEASKINKIYCMTGNCSIIVDGDKEKVLGNYCIICNGRIIYNNIDFLMEELNK